MHFRVDEAHNLTSEARRAQFSPSYGAHDALHPAQIQFYIRNPRGTKCSGMHRRSVLGAGSSRILMHDASKTARFAIEAVATHWASIVGPS